VFGLHLRPGRLIQHDPFLFYAFLFRAVSDHTQRHEPGRARTGYIHPLRLSLFASRFSPAVRMVPHPPQQDRSSRGALPAEARSRPRRRSRKVGALNSTPSHFTRRFTFGGAYRLMFGSFYRCGLRSRFSCLPQCNGHQPDPRYAAT
jgi:hypothetical protein